ncbi:MAG: tyrosine--tRNA ligase [Patescibacteria group bacterium]|nr:tyrosine--tRNA ligase [Patescibacteria group bacterium]
MDKIDELLARGVDKIYPSKEALEKVLRSGKKLRLYQGFDPTGTQLHIGHLVGFRKLRQWQDLGHHVIFLIGDGTGQAGDPSGKRGAREKFMERDELRANAKDYLMQVAKIVNFEGSNPVEILYNSDWLNELKLVDILHIAQNFSVQQLIERDMYQERLKRGEQINLREFLYPLLQGYDSVAMDVDLEQGGTDQTFNMLAGRTLVKNMLGKEKFVMTTPLLTDAEGNKIGKSEGNVIGVTDPPSELFAKIMSLKDSAIINCFTLITALPLNSVAQKENRLKDGENPINLKKELAAQIVSEVHSPAAAKKAQEEFEKTFQKREVAADLIEEVSAAPGKITDRLVEAGIVASKSEAKRLEDQGAIEEIEPNLYRIGKRKFIRFK